MQIDITDIVVAILGVLSAIITTVVVPWIKSKTNDQQQQQILGWVRLAVQAAEMIYKGPGRGQEKKAYVEAWLAERGIVADYDKLDLMIESAVFELNGGVSRGAA